MYSVTRRTTATPERVWEVLADGWTYPLWVVGASRIRAVAADWPAVGSTLHHSVGVWPALLDDETKVLEVDPGRHLRLQARGRPAGEAVVHITLEPEPTGSGTLVTISEDVLTGPVRFVPRPARQGPIMLRNRETLKRLVLLAERHSRP